MCVCVCVCVKSLQLCLTLCDTMDCSLQGSAVHRILQAIILQWFSVPSSRESSQPSNRTFIFFGSCTAGRFFTAEPLEKPIHTYIYGKTSACNAGDPGLIPVLGRSPGEGNANPLHYSCLEKPMDRGAWQARVHGIARVRHNLVTKLPPYIYTHTHIHKYICVYTNTRTLKHKYIHKMWHENCFPPSIYFLLAGGKTQV